MNNKLKLDEKTVFKCRQTALWIAEEVQSFIDIHSTIAVERTIVRFFGVDGVDEVDVPLPNVVVEAMEEHGLLEEGAVRFFARALKGEKEKRPDLSIISNSEISEEKLTSLVIDIARSIGEGTFDFDLPEVTNKEVDEFVGPYVNLALRKINMNRIKRDDFINDFGETEGAYIYVIVATGNIYEDVTQAVAAARQGADVIAVIRTTGQSLLDYVPYGPTTEGFGGTYATQENFKIMRKALDEVGEEIGHYIRLCNYCSGLCMPEIAVMGAYERLDMMLNDALYGILFRDINMKRTLVDQFFSRIINAYAGVIINTGEDNYLTTADAYEEAHTVLASQFINEQFAFKAGLPEELMGLGHAFEIDPATKDSFVYELAQAQMAKEIFPKAPLKYMPPTKHMTGDIFMGNVQDALFNMVTTLTGQKIHLLGMMTEAIHTPFLADRAVAIENARYIQNAMASLRDEIEFKKDGKMVERADKILHEAYELLDKIHEKGLFVALSEGTFAGVKRPVDGGKGLDGVFEKSAKYINPFMDQMLIQLSHNQTIGKEV